MKRDKLIEVIKKFPENFEFTNYTVDPNCLKHLNDFNPISYSELLRIEKIDSEVKSLYCSKGKFGVWSNKNSNYLKLPNTNKILVASSKKDCKRMVTLLNKLPGLDEIELCVKEI